MVEIGIFELKVYLNDLVPFSKEYWLEDGIFDITSYIHLGR